MRLAIFDVDGTLIDSQHLLVASMTAAFAGESLPPPSRRAILDLVGVPLAQSIAILADSEDAALLDRLLDRYRETYFAGHGAGAMPLFPGVRDMLNAFETAGWLLAVATGKGRRGLDAALALHGLDGRFVATRTADDGPGKPHPSAVGDVCDRVGIDPGRSVMIGDTTFDMEAGRGAGCPCIGVAWGYHPEPDLKEAGAATVVRAMGDLLPTADALIPKDAAA